MNTVQLINDTNFEIEEIADLNQFMEFANKRLELANVIYNVIIVDDKKIHELNQEYRQIDSPTDVISFALEDDTTFVPTEIRVLGDIYISIETARKQAQSYKHPLKRELLFLTIHGLLHLLGYDHMDETKEKEMFELQELILDEYRSS